jgi:hypothetical protein
MAAMTWTVLPGTSVFLVPEESRFVTEAARVIRETVPEGGFPPLRARTAYRR